jgi:hypothetical protein
MTRSFLGRTGAYPGQHRKRPVLAVLSGEKLRVEMVPFAGRDGAYRTHLRSLSGSRKIDKLSLIEARRGWAWAIQVM